MTYSQLGLNWGEKQDDNVDADSNDTIENPPAEIVTLYGKETTEKIGRKSGIYDGEKVSILAFSMVLDGVQVDIKVYDSENANPQITASIGTDPLYLMPLEGQEEFLVSIGERDYVLQYLLGTTRLIVTETVADRVSRRHHSVTINEG